MTETPPMPGAHSSDKVAELEARLAEAAAQVAQVQAELSQARAEDPNLPDVPVPYAGNAPVVMINGQPVQAGQAVDLSAMLGGFNIPPVVTVNGQMVSGGSPVDLSSIVGPEAVAHIRSSLEQLGLGGQLAGLFGPAPAAYATTPGEVTESSNKGLLLLAAFLAVGLVGVVVYLLATG